MHAGRSCTDKHITHLTCSPAGFGQTLKPQTCGDKRSQRASESTRSASLSSSSEINGNKIGKLSLKKRYRNFHYTATHARLCNQHQNNETQKDLATKVTAGGVLLHRLPGADAAVAEVAGMLLAERISMPVRSHRPRRAVLQRVTGHTTVHGSPLNVHLRCDVFTYPFCAP